MNINNLLDRNNNLKMNELCKTLGKCSFPTDYEYSNNYIYSKRTFEFSFFEKLISEIDKTCDFDKNDLYKILIGAVAVLLHRYSGTEEMTLGISPWDCGADDSPSVVGIMLSLSEEMRFCELMGEIESADLGEYGYDTVVLLEKEYEENRSHSMIFRFYRSDRGLAAEISYNAAIYCDYTIADMACHLENILRDAIGNIQKTIFQIEIFGEQQRNKLLFDFNDTKRTFSNENTLNALFEAQVNKSPELIAIEYKGKKLTYKELDERANKLAEYLKEEHKLQRDSLVGIMMERSENLIIAMLGVLKAGGAYVPIDPELPEKRIKKIINDAGTSLILSNRGHVKLLNNLQWECGSFDAYLCMDSYDVYSEPEEQKNELMDERLWEYMGRDFEDEIGAGGWINSYTGERFSKREMDEFGANIVAKLKPFIHEKGKQAKILEIGCATGLSMFKLAPMAGLYYGTDLSRVIIEKNRRKVIKRGIKNIKLAALPADRINEIEEKDFDIVILNSVIQYFHGHNYLRNVISKIVDIMGNTGIIFIGDIMDQELRQDLVQSTLEFRNNNPQDKYRTKTDWSKELFAARGFFEDLALETAGIKSVSFSSKLHTIENELTKYRYDAIFVIDKHEENAGETRLTRSKRQHGIDSVEKYDGLDLQTAKDSSALAYVIYTSGSTGEPKGVMLEHRSVVNFINAMREIIDFASGKAIAALTTISFDIFVLETLLPLTCGMRVVIADESTQRDPRFLSRFIADNKIDMLQLTPSRLRMLMADDHGSKCLRGLKEIMVGGESFPVDLLEGLKESSNAKIYNLYGPTETTVWSAVKELSEASQITIGKPIANTQIYIIDKYNNMQPIGAAGELCIGGAGLARGYLNNPELTADRFADNPFVEGSKIYKTGDIARWLPDGELEYIGRDDFQVKIRGFRIELGEIESVLLRHESIRGAVVFNNSDSSGSMYLCAYYTSEKEIPISELRDHISRELPYYMVPSYFMRLEKLPLSINGKIDRGALPKPGSTASFGTGYAAPTNEIEEKLAEIWCEVLYLERVGINDDFFELGGHSLRATFVLAKVHKTLDVDIPLREMFERPTIKQMSEYIAQADKSICMSIEPVDRMDYYPVSSAQKRLFALNQFKDESTVYNICQAMLVEGKLDTERLEWSFRELIKRHETLRTSFRFVHGEAVQIIHGQADFQIDIMECTETEPDAAIERFIRPFDLSRAPLLRVGLLRLGDDRHLFIYDMHHIVSDGISLDILLREFSALYSGEVLPPLRIQYKDYCAWQALESQYGTKDIINQGHIKKQKEYWLHTFDDEIPVLNMPTDYPRPAVQSFEGDSIRCSLGRAMTDSLKTFASEKGVTLYMILLAAYNVLLSKYTGQQDIVVGTPIAGRPHADLEGIVGVFVNTLAMRNRPEADKCFVDFLEEIKENALRAYENQDYQFEELVENIKVKRDLSRNPVFDTMFAMQNVEYPEVNIEGLSFSFYEYENKKSKFDMTVFATEINGDIELCIQYSTKLFKKSTIEGLGEHFINVLADILAKPEKRLGEINMLSRAERNKLLYGFNNTHSEYSSEKTLWELFEERALSVPGNISTVCGTDRLTYGELYAKANKLAYYLKEIQGVKTGDMVGIMQSPSVNLIVSILAVWRLGAAYVPIDRDAPTARIRYILGDTEIKTLLTDEDYGLGNIEANIVKAYETLDSAGEIQKCTEMPFDSGSTAYVIYTSGTTGQPKGVVISHRSLVNYISWFKRAAALTSADKTMLLSSYAFDLGYTALYSALVEGCQLHLMSREEYGEPERLLSYIRDNHITYIKATPSLFNIIVNAEAFEKDSCCESLRLIVLGGEQIKPKDIEKYHSLYPQAVIMNHYGPTETTIGAIAGAIDFDDFEEYRKSPVIGKAIDNTKIYILDKSLQPLPLGIPGEIYIAGDGLALGYLNRPDLDAEKFIPDPFNDKGRKMYKTGDLGRYRENGSIEFLGRVDNQVKIRGYRVELEEIEAALLKLDGIREASVVDREDSTGGKFLCAYMVADRELLISELRDSLSMLLPEYMIPSYFVQLEEMPLTANHKIDKKALPKSIGAMRTGRLYKAPETWSEKKLESIWKELLSVERAGINDNFFELGGHSLKAISMISRIYKEMGIQLTLRDIFNMPTIKALGEYISKAEHSIYAAIEQAGYQEYYPVSPAQKRMLAVEQLEENGTSYNTPRAIMIEGNLKKGRLEETFTELIKRHEILRTAFLYIEGESVQKIYDKTDFCIEYLEAEESELEAAVKGFIRPFDMSTAPLLRARLVRLAEKKHLLLYDIHHAVVDGISRSILISEFISLYAGKKLEEPKFQYKDYCIWEKVLKQTDAHHGQQVKLKYKEEEKYWLERFIGEIPVLNMPLDYQRPAVQSFEGDRLSFTIDSSLSDRLRQFAVETGTTLYMILLAAYNVLLSKYTGQQDIIVGTPAAGRPYVELESIVGMFVNTLAMRNYPAKDKNFMEFLYEVKENSLSAFENQNYQLQELVDSVLTKRDLSRNPLFDTMLAVQNVDMPEITILGFKLSEYEFENKISKFDISIFITEREQAIDCVIEYCTRLFKSETIELLADHFVEIVRDILDDPNKRLETINMLSEAERSKLLYKLNPGPSHYPADKTIHQLFEEQVRRTPNHTAVIFDGKSLTYKELNEKANQLARQLKAFGAEKNKIAAIMTERSLEMIIGILAILKSGCAYLPIDPTYPADRIDYMLSDSGADILLTQRHLTDTIIFDGRVLKLEDESLYTGNTENLSAQSCGEDLVYTIYTSGSTGKPKAVMLEHRNLVNLLSSEFNNANIDFTGRVLQFTTISFDVSFQEIFSTLLTGGELYLIDNELRGNVPELFGFIEKNNIDILFFPTSFLKFIMSEERLMAAFPKKVSHIITSGEQLIVSEGFKEYMQKNRVYLHNQYGPSETHVATALIIGPDDTIPRLPSIGKPIANSAVYILDENKRLQPVGIPGELYIAGSCVGRGYLGRSGLTAEKFIPDPFNEGRIMYETGDVGRWLHDGTLEFLGRTDHQIKVRGFRVEPGEIEAVLLRHKAVKLAAVAAFSEKNTGEGDNKYLCAYIEVIENTDASELRSFLAAELPDYMIPTYFISLKKMPITPNGKIDRKALPDPRGISEQQINSRIKYRAPESAMEKKLVELWQEVLGVQNIGIDNNFFELGGHSLKAMSMASRIYKEFAVQLTLRQIFRMPTIKGLAKFIENAVKAIYKEIESVEVKDYYLLSSAQKRLLLLEQFRGPSINYNVSEIYIIEGNLDRVRLEDAFKKLVQRHEALRTSFDFIHGEPVQCIHETADFSVDFEEIEEQQIEIRIKEFIRPFDLSSAPLIRVYLGRISSSRHLLIFDLHHIIFDGMSKSILLEELVNLYRGIESEMPSLRYRDYAEWQSRLQTSSYIRMQEQYWLDRFGDGVPEMNLPTDYPGASAGSMEGGRVKLAIGEELTKKLKGFASEAETTLYMVLLAAYNVLLSKYTGKNDIVVGTPTAGRPYGDLENVIGMFVNTLAIRNYPREDKSFMEFLKEVNDNTLLDFENQDYKFEELVEKLIPNRPTNSNPLFDTMLVLQNTEDTAINLEGLNFIPYEFSSGLAKFDLTFLLTEKEKEISVEIEYKKVIYREQTVWLLGQSYIEIIDSIMQNRYAKLRDIKGLNDLLIKDREIEDYQIDSRQIIDEPRAVNSLLIASSPEEDEGDFEF